MLNQLESVTQRALIPFIFAAALTIGLHQAVPALRTPLASGLLAIVAFLLVLRPIEDTVRSSSRFRTRVLLIGTRPLVQKLIEEIEAAPKRGYTILGLVEETASYQMRYCPYLVLGTIDELSTIVAAVKPDLIVLALSDRRGRMPTDQLLELQSNGIVVEDVADTYERVSGKLAIEAVTPGQLIASQKFRKSGTLKATQRLLSFTAALIGLVVISPILGLIALAIKLDSGGPVFFRQTRLGKANRPFKLIKFRTMRPIEAPTSEWVQDNLLRITRIGKWLRRLRLDELPQLVNVIRGEMNLVGPRPHPVCNLQLFRDAIPFYTLRGSVLPGISGWAQTRYHYANNLEQETEKMRYDLYYIKNMSLWMDLHILLDTCAIFLWSLTPARAESRPYISRAEERAPAQRHSGPHPIAAANSTAPRLRVASDRETPRAVQVP